MSNLATKPRISQLTGHELLERVKHNTAFSFSFKILCGFIGNAVDLMHVDTLIIMENTCV